MARRKNFHAPIYFSKDGRFVCSKCGAEVDEHLTSKTSCIEPITALTAIRRLPLYISVYNLRAFLVVEVPKGFASVLAIAFEPSEDIADELEKLLEQDVQGQGGGLTMSGLYALSAKTARKIAEWLAQGKLKLSW